MRSVIVDFVRQRQTDRRGGDAAHVTFTTQLAGGVSASEEQILRVNDALLDLEKVDERMAKVVELRYFGGLTEIEIAQALGVTDRTQAATAAIQRGLVPLESLRKPKP